MSCQTPSISTRFLAVFNAPGRAHFVTNTLDTSTKTVRLFQNQIANSRVLSYCESIAYKIPFVNQVLGIIDFFSDLSGLIEFSGKTEKNPDAPHASGIFKRLCFVLCDILYIISFTCVIFSWFAPISLSIFVAIQTITLIIRALRIIRTSEKIANREKILPKPDFSKTTNVNAPQGNANVVPSQLKKSKGPQYVMVDARLDLLHARLWRDIFYTILSTITVAAFIFVPLMTVASTAIYLVIIGILSMACDWVYYGYKTICINDPTYKKE